MKRKTALSLSFLGLILVGLAVLLYFATKDCGSGTKNPEKQIAMPAEYELQGLKGPVKNTSYEYEEQKLLVQNLRPGDRVLQLGGNIGTSCITAAMAEPGLESNVCVEPNTNLASIIEANVSQLGVAAGVQILPKMVTKANCSVMRLKGTDSHQGNAGYIEEGGEGLPVECTSLADVMKEKNKGAKFTVLFADCEGCLPGFVEENAELLDELRVLIYEHDRGSEVDYSPVKKLTKRMNCKGDFNVVCTLKKKFSKR